MIIFHTKGTSLVNLGGNHLYQRMIVRNIIRLYCKTLLFYKTCV